MEIIVGEYYLIFRDDPRNDHLLIKVTGVDYKSNILEGIAYCDSWKTRAIKMSRSLGNFKRIATPAGNIYKLLYL